MTRTTKTGLGVIFIALFVLDVAADNQFVPDMTLFRILLILDSLLSSI
jgi:hypothetical protein